MTIEGLGEGAGLRMWRADYANSSHYNHSEYRHGLVLSKVTGATITGLEIAELGGDGIYLRWIANVVIQGVTTDGAYRNGLSVIGANGLQVHSCRFLRTGNTGAKNGGETLTPMNGGTAPRAGVDLEPNGASESLLNVTFRDCVASGNVGNAWDISTDTNHTILFERCVAENCGGGYFLPEMASGFCSGFNFQNEIGAYPSRNTNDRPLPQQHSSSSDWCVLPGAFARPRSGNPWWPNNTITGVGSIEMIDCSAANLSGAALQLLMGNYERSGDATASDVASTFTVRNFTATDVAQVWEQPYKDHSNGGFSGFYPITIASKNHDGVWMDRGVDSEFDGFHVRRSNAVGRPTDGRPPIGCINTTWLSARAALFLPVPCNPARLWRLRGRVDVDATNRSACSATGLGGAGAGLQINCGSLPPPGRQ